jgi:hypothetical protein
MGDESMFRPVKLMFPGEDGKYYAEYIPPKMNIISNRLSYYRLMYSLKHHKPLYYWYYNHLLTPAEIKVIDLSFIIHVLKDHSDTNPLETREWQHYNKIYPNYAKEFDQFAAEELRVWRKPSHNKKLRMQQDPYIKAYKKHWIDTFTFEPNFKTLYHGADISEANEVLQKIKDSIDEEFNARARAKGQPKKDFIESYNNPSPDQIKSQKEVDYSNIDTKTGFKILFWVANAFYTIAAVSVLAFDTMAEDSIVSRIGATLSMVLFIQVLFLTPYFGIIGILKLANHIKSKFSKKEQESEAHPEE